MNDPLVDVGIPSHGRPAYLVEAVESVLAQTLPDWRLVISEDGDGDEGVRSALDPYLGDPRVTHVTTGGHIGAARNMTSLIQHGEAPFVGLLHDDDKWGPGFLERRVAFLCDQPECGLVFSPHVDIDGSGWEIGRSVPRLAAGVHPVKALARRMLAENLVDTPTVLVRRTAYEECGPRFDEGFPTLYDWEMMLRLTLRFPAGYLHTWDAAYRTHGDQTSAQPERGAEYLRLLDHGDELARATAADARLPGKRRRAIRAGYLLSSALDDLARAEAASAARAVRGALRESPRAVLDRRFWAAVASLAVPGPGRRAIAAARRAAFRRRTRPDRQVGSR